MGKRLITYLLYIVIAANFAFAQTSSDSLENAPPPFMLKPTLGLGAGTLGFYGDIINKRLSSTFVSNIGYELYITQPINNYFSFRFYYLTGKLSANERNYIQPLNFQSRLNCGGGELIYNFGHLLSDERAVEPYLFTGFETFEFLSKTDLYDANGNLYYYWTDGSIKNLPQTDANKYKAIDLKRDYVYESDLREANIDGLGKYAEHSFAIPVGIGMNVPINDKINLKIGTSVHFTFSDNIDNVTGKSIGTRKGDNKNDKFIYSSFSLSYNLTPQRDLDELERQEIREFFLAMGDGDYDQDSVIDFLDKEGLTPVEAAVNEHGVANDADGDRVPDIKDEEQNSGAGAMVNTKGVTLTDALILEQYEMYMDSTGEKNMKLVRNKTIESPGGSGLFTVELGAFKTGVPPELINKFLSVRDIQSITGSDSVTVYTSGRFTGYNNAKARKEMLQKEGFADAKVVLYRDGKRVDINDANYKKFENEIAASTSANTGRANTNWEGGTAIEIGKGKTGTGIKTETGKAGTETPGDFSSDVKVEGTVYRIQLGAFKKKVSRNAFGDINDVVAVPTDNGVTRYYTGQFNNFNDAAKYKIDLVTKGYTGAFIVAFKDGARVTLQSTGVQYVGKTPEDLQAETQGEVDKKLVVFKVQVGAFKGDAPADVKAKLEKQQGVEKSVNAAGAMRYTVGSFNDYKAAQAKKKELQEAGFKDAFIIAFFKDNQIDIQEALELQK